MNTRYPIPALALVLLTASGSCNGSDPAEAAAAAPAKADEHASHDGEGAGAREPSDLDRPVDELVGLTCEHERRTYQCEECRYEVGFVRAPAALTEGGLITTTTAEWEKVAVPVTLTGEVRFDERRIGRLRPQVEGVVRKVLAAVGDRVRAGQPLVEIESVLAGEAQAAYLEARTTLDLTRRNFERIAGLREEGVSSERELVQAEQELEAAAIRAEGALGRLRRLGTRGTRGARIVLGAPVDGIVLAMGAVPGEVAGTEDAVATVGDTTTVLVWADLYEGDIAVVKEGLGGRGVAASISVKAYPGEEFPGTVELVGPAMDESSRTAKVRIEVRNADGRLLSGMFATCRLFLPGAAEVLALPRAAVLEDAGRSFVFVRYDGEYYVRRPVDVGRAWPGWVEIRKGLEPSQTVAAEGAFLMKSDVLRSKMGAGCAD